jgi:hypothetical protein
MIRQYNPRFATPDVLASIDPPDLLRVLRRYRKGLIGITLSRADRLNIGELSSRIMAGVGLPGEFIDTVCMIDELAKARVHDRLVEIAEGSGLVVGDEDFEHRLVVKALLAADSKVRDLLLEQNSLSRKSYGRYMAMASDMPRLTRAHRRGLRSLEEALDQDFKSRRRQRGDGVVRGRMFKEPHGLRIIVRRGDLKRSVLTIDDDNDGKSNRVIYRPELHDVIRYDNRYGDLLVCARSKADTRAYCNLVGQHLFSDRFAFDPHLAPRRYTLNAIREHGAACLTCADIDGIEHVRLKTLDLRPPDSDGTPIRVGPGDALQAVYQLLGGRIDRDVELIRATFAILLRGERRERTLVITPPITASFDIDHACEPIQQFIELRQFLLPRSESLLGAPETLFSLY